MLAITVLAISWTDIALAALAYHHDVGSTVRARSIVQPWMISIVAFGWSYVSLDDGLIVAYVFSMVAALVAALIPLMRCYGVPHGWKPDLPLAWGTAVRNAPLAAADTVEWASRRIDLAVLGAFMPASFVGIYYAAQQVATLAGQAEDQLRAGARPGDRPPPRGRRSRRNRQASAPGHLLDHRRSARDCAGARYPGPGGDGAGRIGVHRRHGDARLPARRRGDRRGRGRQRSRADLRRAQAQHGDQPGHAGARGRARRGVDPDHAERGLPAGISSDGAGDRAVHRAGLRLDHQVVAAQAQAREPVCGWRWDLAWATASGVIVGCRSRLFLPQRWQLFLGVPAIIVAFFAVLWTKGFGPEDRELFRLRKDEVQELRDAEEAAQARDQIETILSDFPLRWREVRRVR